MPTHPETSLEAFREVTPQMLAEHHKTILIALKVLGNGNYEQIATAVAMEKHQVGRRLKELEVMQLIYKTGEKRLTSTNRSAYVYKLVQNGEVSAQPEKLMEGETVADISRKMLTPLQRTLFDN